MSSNKKISIHATNIHGLGASCISIEIINSLIKYYCIDTIFVSNLNDKHYSNMMNGCLSIIRYNRWVPKSLSRIFELVLFSSFFRTSTPLLVLGDLPLRISCPQFLLFHNLWLLSDSGLLPLSSKLRRQVSCLILKLNEKYVTKVFVQSEYVKYMFCKNFPNYYGRVVVLKMPAPAWIVSFRNSRVVNKNTKNKLKKMTVFYPASPYEHKNHAILNYLDPTIDCAIDKIILTINENDLSLLKRPYLSFIGEQSIESMINLYQNCDGLLFLSLEESLGLPLLEAMTVGIPIICPNLPYAKMLCGDEAIYFDPNDAKTLEFALYQLQKKICDGWWPNWQDRLIELPSNWDDVCLNLLSLIWDSPDISA